MQDEPRLEDQAISKVAEMLLSTQIDAADKLDVDVHADLGKLVQGQTGSISISGERLVTQQDLQIKEIDLQIDQVDVNLFSALLGKIELNQPIDSTGKIVVTETDINRNLNSDYLRSRPIGLEVTVEGQPVLLTFQAPMKIQLPGNGKVIFSSDIQILEKGEHRSVHFTGAVYPRTDQHSVLMESFSLGEGQSLSIELMAAFMDRLRELIDAPYINLGDMAFQIQRMEVHQGSIDLFVKLKMNQIPV
ncbi:MAG TPA: DUF2993 domain-containing protein [Leptolyngbyaceae cyanobacterium]